MMRRRWEGKGRGVGWIGIKFRHTPLMAVKARPPACVHCATPPACLPPPHLDDEVLVGAVQWNAGLRRQHHRLASDSPRCEDVEAHVLIVQAAPLRVRGGVVVIPGCGASTDNLLTRMSWHTACVDSQSAPGLRSGLMHHLQKTRHRFCSE